MAKQIIIKLIEPFQGMGKDGELVNEVIVREPNGRDFAELGEPYVFARNGKELIITAENENAIKAYIERCIVQPNVLLTMNGLKLADMIQVKEAILDFFAVARRAASANS